MNKLDKKNAQFIGVYDYMWGDELSNSGAPILPNIISPLLRIIFHIHTHEL